MYMYICYVAVALAKPHQHINFTRAKRSGRTKRV